MLSDWNERLIRMIEENLELTMEDNEGSFVAVRRLSHGSERSTSYHSSPGN